MHPLCGYTALRFSSTRLTGLVPTGHSCSGLWIGNQDTRWLSTSLDTLRAEQFDQHLELTCSQLIEAIVSMACSVLVLCIIACVWCNTLLALCETMPFPIPFWCDIHAPGIRAQCQWASSTQCASTPAISQQQSAQVLHPLPSSTACQSGPPRTIMKDAL